MQPWRYAPQHLPRLLELLCRASTLQCGPPRHQPLLVFDREGTGVFAVSGKFLGQGHTKFIGGNSTCYRSYAISVGSAEWVDVCPSTRARPSALRVKLACQLPYALRAGAQDAQGRQLQPPTRTSASSIERGGIWRLPGRRQRMRRGHRCGSRVDLTNTLDTDPHVAIFGNLCITASMTGRQGTVTTRVPPLSTASSSARGT